MQYYHFPALLPGTVELMSLNTVAPTLRYTLTWLRTRRPYPSELTLSKSWFYPFSYDACLGGFTCADVVDDPCSCQASVQLLAYIFTGQVRQLGQLMDGSKPLSTLSEGDLRLTQASLIVVDMESHKFSFLYTPCSRSTSDGLFVLLHSNQDNFTVYRGISGIKFTLDSWILSLLRDPSRDRRLDNLPGHDVFTWQSVLSFCRDVCRWDQQRMLDLFGVPFKATKAQYAILPINL